MGSLVNTGQIVHHESKQSSRARSVGRPVGRSGGRPFLRCSDSLCVSRRTPEQACACRVAPRTGTASKTSRTQGSPCDVRAPCPRWSPFQHLIDVDLAWTLLSWSRSGRPKGPRNGRQAQDVPIRKTNQDQTTDHGNWPTGPEKGANAPTFFPPPGQGDPTSCLTARDGQGDAH